MIKYGNIFDRVEMEFDKKKKLLYKYIKKHIIKIYIIFRKKEEYSPMKKRQ